MTGMARAAAPELVILDVMLPDEDGYQILAQLRPDPATMLTGLPRVPGPARRYARIW